MNKSTRDLKHLKDLAKIIKSRNSMNKTAKISSRLLFNKKSECLKRIQKKLISQFTNLDKWF